MRILILVLLLLAAAAVLVLHHLLFRRPLPRIAGTVTLDGISAPVRITRDPRGIPHIEAETVEDAAFACGFVHAQDRGWQLEFTRRAACGRLAEFGGKEALPADRLLRQLGLYRTALAEEAALSGRTRSVLEAYSAGVNAVLCSGMQPLPVEMQLLRLRFEPWRPAHSLAYLKLIQLGLALDMDMELQRLRVLQAAGPALATKLELAYPDENPDVIAGHAAAVTPEAAQRLAATYRDASRWLPAGTGAAASNNWVVDGTVTTTGRPMLCNDPHLPPSAPSIWYQLHVTAADDFESAGVGPTGLPFVLLGHNRRIAWGFTNSFADVQDLVVEEFADSSCSRYRTENGLEDSVIIEERIRVRGGDEVVEKVVITRHGPLLERFEAPGSGPVRGLVLQWDTLTPRTDAVDGYLELQRAGTWDEFRRAVRLQAGAPQNCVYADVDGHIGYTLGGYVPTRRQPASRLPLPGWEADRRFTGHLDVDQLPHVLDPEDHVLVTANNRIVGDDYPHHIAFDYMNGYRALRIDQLLRGRTGIDAQLMAAMQMDIVCPPARALIELLRPLHFTDAVAEEARAGLSAWDGVMDPEAIEPSVYVVFMRQLGREVLEPHLGEDWTLLAGQLPHALFGYTGNITGRLTPFLLHRWERDDTELLGGRSWAEVAETALGAAMAELRSEAGRRPTGWRWGRLHAMPVVHVLGTRWPLSLIFNLSPLEIGGDTDTVLQAAFVPGDGYRARGWAPGWRHIIDVGNWEAATGILIPGESGHPGSRHYRDLVDDWRRNRQWPLGWSAARGEEPGSARLLLRPRPPAESIGEDEAEREAA
jgi:penicillin amidase